MNDLERVRELRQKLVDADQGDGWPPDGSVWLLDQVLVIIDAHLEKDAEREAAWSSKAEDYIIELTELREENERLRGYVTWPDVKLDREKELTELREKHKRLQNHVRSESSRLMQIDAARNKAKAELTELREAVRAHVDGPWTPAGSHDGLRRLIRGEAMTDLGRVREAIRQAVLHDRSNPGGKYDEAIDELDAHLEEDAEREEMLTAVDFYQDNLRLRSEVKRLQHMLMQDTVPDEFTKTHDELRAELAELREEHGPGKCMRYTEDGEL